MRITAAAAGNPRQGGAFRQGADRNQPPAAAGRHTLQLLLGDQHHVPHNPPGISKKITITVKQAPEAGADSSPEVLRSRSGDFL